MDSLETYEISSEIDLGFLPFSDEMTRVSAKVSSHKELIEYPLLIRLHSVIQGIKQNMVPSLNVDISRSSEWFFGLCLS